MAGRRKQYEREHAARIALAWHIEAFSRAGKHFPRRLADALPKPPWRPKATRQSTEQMMATMDLWRVAQARPNH